jgi:hypothetical protein
LRRLSVGLLGAVLLATATASADVTKAQCIQANTQAQSLRRAGKFAQARDELRTCADPTCPALVQGDCTTRLDELNKVQPTIVFIAKDASGADVGSVTVTVDGQPLTDKLNGTAVAIDPGQHVFTFTATGRPPVTRTLILAEGDKDRREVISLEGGATPPSPQPTTSTTAIPSAAPTASVGEIPSQPKSGGSSRTIGFVVGGAGVAAIAAGTYFGVTALSQKSDADGACGGHGSVCPTARQTSDAQAKLQDARTSGWISTAALGVGAVAVVVGAYLVFFSRGSSSESPSRGSSSESPAAALTLTPSGAFLAGSF